ncbi:YlaH-like family protein [Gorillibacterium massiliense]|uniref:YlaH-like family protein n=1 Tax=Gorillibacterium massiliense TaxID=1280390 RepID=UPI0004B79034|nr:YlaH-like family protein [Gorillibacterium massiliense]
MNHWFADHPWITFLFIYIMLVYVYNKVFRTRKLPLLKDLLVYLLIAVGGVILLFFQIDLELPIVYCLAVAILLMFIVRVRMWATERKNKEG